MATSTSQAPGLPVTEAVSLNNTPPVLSNVKLAVQTDQPIKLFFNKKVMAGSGEVIISNGSDTRTIAINDASQITFNESTVTIDPIADWVTDTTYQVQMAGGVIVDVEGREFAGTDHIIDRVNFTTFDAHDPRLSGRASLDYIEFQVDQNITLNFDERVVAGEGSIVLSNGTDTRMIAIDDTSQVQFINSGKVAVNPTEDLLGDTVYSLEIAEGVITDEQSNPFAGVSDATIATITTDPELLHSNPINHSTLKTDADIELFFDRTVTVGSGDIIISNGEDIHTIAIDDTSQVTFGSTAVIINPAEDFQIDTVYTVNMADGVIADTAGHDYPGFKDATVTIVPPGPTFLYSSLESPEEWAVDDNIVFYFDEEVTAGSGNIVISTGTDTRTIAVNDVGQVSFEDHSLTVNPTEDLIADTNYTIQIEGGAVVDLNGDSYLGIVDLNKSTIASNPFIVSSNAGLPFKIDNDIQLFFNERIELGDGNIVISNGEDTRTIAIADTSQVTLNLQPLNPQQFYDPLVGRQANLIINPTEDLIANTTYTVQIDQGIVTDVVGHEFMGLNDVKLLVHASEPLLVASQPASGSTIKDDDDIYFFFDEEMQAGNGNIVISNGTDTHTVNVKDSTQVTFTVNPLPFYTAGLVYAGQFIPAGHNEFFMTIDLANDLVAGTTYTVQIDEGVITDTAGHAYSGLDNFDFVTTTSEPQLLESNPIDGSTIKIDGEIHLHFDEYVVAGIGDIVLSSDTDTRVISINDISQVNFSGNNVTINPTEDLLSDTIYRVDMASGVIVDEADNAYTGFDGAEVTATNSSPILTHSNSTTKLYMKVDSNIQLQFDEAVVAGGGNIVLSNGSDIRTIAIDDASQVKLNGGKTAIIDPAEDLMADTTYTVTIDAGAITDEAGNPFAGDDFAFTTTDAPILQYPSPGTYIGSANNSINLFFDEEISLGSGDIILSSGEDVRTIAVDDANQVILNDDILTIHPAQKLTSYVTYQIQLESGVVEDVDGNPYIGISEADMINVVSNGLDFGSDPFVPLLL